MLDRRVEEPCWWKEPELHIRLHFTKKRRAFIAMKIVKHFEEIDDPNVNYGIRRPTSTSVTSIAESRGNSAHGEDLIDLEDDGIVSGVDIVFI